MPIERMIDKQTEPGERIPPVGMKSMSADEWVRIVGEREIEEMDKLGMRRCENPSGFVGRFRATRI